MRSIVRSIALMLPTIPSAVADQFVGCGDDLSRVDLLGLDLVEDRMAVDAAVCVYAREVRRRLLVTSVKSLPGNLSTIAPSLIGVPVAFTPGLLPHCDVLTAPAATSAVLPAAGLAVPADPVAALLRLPIR